MRLYALWLSDQKPDCPSLPCLGSAETSGGPI